MVRNNLGQSPKKDWRLPSDGYFLFQIGTHDQLPTWGCNLQCLGSMLRASSHFLLLFHTSRLLHLLGEQLLPAFQSKMVIYHATQIFRSHLTTGRVQQQNALLELNKLNFVRGRKMTYVNQYRQCKRQYVHGRERQAKMAGKSQPKQLDHADAYPLMIMMITVAVARLHDLRKQCGSKLSVTQLFSNTCTLPIS